MAFQVVDGDEGQAVHGGDRLGRHDADDHAADQPRPAGRGDAAEIEAEARFGHGAGDQPVEVFQMGTRRDFRNDAADRAVVGELRQHEIGENFRRSAATTAAAVSSQLVSMPRMIIWM